MKKAKKKETQRVMLTLTVQYEIEFDTEEEYEVKRDLYIQSLHQVADCVDVTSEEEV